MRRGLIMDDYWTEHAEIAVSDAGLTATPDQIQTIAGVIESAHEFYGQSMGHDVASANLRGEREREMKALEDEIQREKDKVPCKVCNGTGETHTYGGTMMSTSQCWKCKGDGRHDL